MNILYTHIHNMHARPYQRVRTWEGPTGAVFTRTFPPGSVAINSATEGANLGDGCCSVEKGYDDQDYKSKIQKEQEKVSRSGRERNLLQERELS